MQLPGGGETGGRRVGTRGENVGAAAWEGGEGIGVSGSIVGIDMRRNDALSYAEG